METPLDIPGTQQVRPFHFFDAQHQPTRCDLVVHPAHGWAIATELPQSGHAGINQCPHTLAAKICGEYDVDPAALVLLVRYAYPAADSYFVVRFIQGDRDLFDGFTFLGPSREPLDPDQVAELLAQLTAGEEPRATFRAVQMLVLSQRSKK
ncbi:hypothetical protein BEN47_16660 [Hymenobacter lapidarius]|uniref:Uncharacterized protein n=1 Tax=Hymenobacter lapidarius TaxID=1908237 RepID=A0A1G1SZQ1_9BACT|nr:hypothetical protein [Hymenobacter lapidarius]OGX84108.1 hypothetical protein BEN47_16660 [Hymenobacter lapidarius]